MIVMEVGAWVLLFYPVWSPRCRRLRKKYSGVSRNPGYDRPEVAALVEIADAVDADLDTWGVGPEWEQDRPFPELFNDEDS